MSTRTLSHSAQRWGKTLRMHREITTTLLSGLLKRAERLVEDCDRAGHESIGGNWDYAKNRWFPPTHCNHAVVHAYQEAVTDRDALARVVAILKEERL